ncbi:hypothetical protein BS47DRAFT_1399871 [Hydnum rufescens UP504]|uniref:Uncharacterized protein n=1 Tax=Hydnum rufescens UP504 TaxID=1448309 RepID=A0A9P6AHM9_9AGAM|nr:hypothetical protein BS47DRAFT_1399871 [Hydnum rufescens UP504]
MRKPQLFPGPSPQRVPPAAAQIFGMTPTNPICRYSRPSPAAAAESGASNVKTDFTKARASPGVLNPNAVVPAPTPSSVHHHQLTYKSASIPLGLTTLPGEFHRGLRASDLTIVLSPAREKARMRGAAAANRFNEAVMFNKPGTSSWNSFNALSGGLCDQGLVDGFLRPHSRAPPFNSPNSITWRAAISPLCKPPKLFPFPPVVPTSPRAVPTTLSPHEPSVLRHVHRPGIPWGEPRKTSPSTTGNRFSRGSHTAPCKLCQLPKANPIAATISADFSILDTIDSLRYAYGKHLVFCPTGIPSFLQSPADLPSQTHEPLALPPGSNLLDPSTVLDDCFKQGSPNELGFMKHVIADRVPRPCFLPSISSKHPFCLGPSGFGLIYPVLRSASAGKEQGPSKLQKEGPYRKRKRASNKAASKANEAARLRKRERSQMRLLEQQQRKAIVRAPEGWEQTDKRLTPPMLSMTLRLLLPVEYDPGNRAPTLVVDHEHRLVILRSFRDSRMMDEWMVSWLRVLDCFAAQTKITEPACPHRRGTFAQRLLGFNQANGNNNNIPFKMAFTVDYQTEIDSLIASSEFQLICEVLTKLLDQYFPAIAAKYRAADRFWRSETGNRVTLQFSLFFCVAINATVKSPVKTVPHRDFKNVAIGVCAIFVLGFFDDGETAWLVNFEAGIIIQLPTGIFLLYPSALIMHFNVNKNEFFSNEHPLKFVCTQKGEIPNALNSVPLCSINPGRASLVFFNPASFFYPLTTGFTTLEEARAAGLSGELDFAEEARSSFNKVS